MSLRLPVTIVGLSLGLLGWSGQVAPSTTRYRVEVRGEQVIDLSSVNQPEQRQHFGMTGFLTVSLEDTAGGKAMDVLLDSMTVDSGSPLPPAIVDSARGSTWHGLVSPGGRVLDLKSGVRTLASGQFDGLLASFFPRVKPGAKRGDAWTDTLDYATDDGANSFKVRTVTNYSATGNEKRSGADALKLESAFSSARSGVIQNGQGQLTIDGTGTGKGIHYLAVDGRYLGGKTEDNADLSLVAPGAPGPIPIKTRTTVTVTTLP